MAARRTGLLSSVTVGILLVNVASRNGWVKYSRMQTGTSRRAKQGLTNPDDRPIAGLQTVSGDSIDSMARQLGRLRLLASRSLPTAAAPASMRGASRVQMCVQAWHLVIVGIAILIGYGAKQLLIIAAPGVGSTFPLFPLAMLSGLMMQIALQACPAEHAVGMWTVAMLVPSRGTLIMVGCGSVSEDVSYHVAIGAPKNGGRRNLTTG